MIDRNYILNIVKSKDVTIDEFNYDKLIAPPIYAYFTDYDLQRLTEIATSLRYSSKPQAKYQEIDKIMKSRGFSKLSAGTNRVVYKCNENDRFVAKIAVDSIGMSDNPREFINQQYLKPFCAKTFEVYRSGVLAFSERVNPITNREEFLSVAEDIFTLITEFIIDGTKVLDDMGSKYFMNYGLRRGFGPVLLDYTFLYHLDGNKLFCCRPDPTTESHTCGGELDYDAGYNNIVCKKCGAIYRAKDLELKIKENKIITKSFKGEYNKMKVSIKGGSKNFDVTTTIKSIEVEEPKQTTEEAEVVYVDKKRNVHVSLGHRDDQEVTIVNNKKVKEDNSPEVVVTEVAEDIVPLKEATEEVATEAKVLSSPIKVGNDKKEDKDIIRDELFNSGKTISGAQLRGTATSEYLMSALKGVKFVIDTLRSTTEWNSDNEAMLLEYFFESPMVSERMIEEKSDEGQRVIKSEIIYEDSKDMYVLSSDCYVVDTVVEIDEENNTEEPAKEIEIIESEEGSEVKAEDTEIIDDYSEAVDEVDEEEDDDNYYDSVQMTGYVPFSAKVIDISTKLATEEHKNVILIEDSNGNYLTVGNGDKYLVVDRVDGLDINEARIVSKTFVDNILRISEEKATELTKDTYKEEVKSTVNGVPTKEQ